MKISDIVLLEDAVAELVKDLKHPGSYDAIDHMMQTIARKHKITAKELHNRFVKKYGIIPDDYIKESINPITGAGAVAPVDPLTQRKPIDTTKSVQPVSPAVKVDINQNKEDPYAKTYSPVEIKNLVSAVTRLEAELKNTGANFDRKDYYRKKNLIRQYKKNIQNLIAQQSVVENFHDGKKPGRKGLAKRSGVNCKQSVTKLRNIAAHSTGERQRMAHWCANMKSGKKK